MNPNQPIKSGLRPITAFGTQAPKPRLLSRGLHSGFEKLKSKPGVYRCRLRPELAKRDPRHADYKGILTLTGSKALILLWVHEDGALGLRLEKITPKVPRTSHS